MDAEGERGAVAGEVVEQPIDLVRSPAHNVQHRAEDFFFQFVARDRVRRSPAQHKFRAAGTAPSQRKRSAAMHAGDPALELVARLRRRSPGRPGSLARAGRPASVRARRRSPCRARARPRRPARTAAASAEQRWPAERKAEAMTSSVTCSGSAVASTIMALMPPVSAISAGIGPSLAASARLMMRATSVEPVKATPATAACAGEQAADLAVARHQMQRACRHAGFVQQLARLRKRSAASARRAWRRRYCRQPAPPSPGR